MRLTRAHIERMCSALDTTEADEFYIDVQVDGKLTFGAIEKIERKTPIRLTPVKKAEAYTHES